jgi:pilus assembly protein CpaB
MSPVRLIILVIAAGAAIGAVFLVRSMQAPAPAVAAADMPAAPAPVAVEFPLKQILVASNTIPAGKYVSLDDLKWQGWPADAQMDSFIDKEKEAEALEKMVGAVARFDIVAGEPVTRTKLKKPGTAGFMSVMLTPGMRAVSIEIETETAAGGFIQPNDRVDVIVTREVENANAKAQANPMAGIRSDLILANIRVLAIDHVYGTPPVEGGEEEVRTGQGAVIVGSRATLELNERDATLVSTARKAGDLSLTLRSIADLSAPQGATSTGKAYRDGVSQDAEGVRIYRYGTETVSSATAG